MSVVITIQMDGRNGMVWEIPDVAGGMYMATLVQHFGPGKEEISLAEFEEKAREESIARHPSNVEGREALISEHHYLTHGFCMHGEPRGNCDKGGLLMPFVPETHIVQLLPKEDQQRVLVEALKRYSNQMDDEGNVEEAYLADEIRLEILQKRRGRR